MRSDRFRLPLLLIFFSTSINIARSLLSTPCKISPVAIAAPRSFVPCACADFETPVLPQVYIFFFDHSYGHSKTTKSRTPRIISGIRTSSILLFIGRRCHNPLLWHRVSPRFLQAIERPSKACRRLKGVFICTIIDWLVQGLYKNFCGLSGGQGRYHTIHWPSGRPSPALFLLYRQLASDGGHHPGKKAH